MKYYKGRHVRVIAGDMKGSIMKIFKVLPMQHLYVCRTLDYTGGLYEQADFMEYQVEPVIYNDKFTCYEIHLTNIPDNGCKNQCKECNEKEHGTKTNV